MINVRQSNRKIIVNNALKLVSIKLGRIAINDEINDGHISFRTLA